jgi:hypothetical protein
MNLSMRVLIAVVAAAGVVGLAGAYLGAAALQDESPSETAAEPTPGESTPSPSPTTPVASGTPASVPSDWQEYTDSALGFSLRFPPDLTATDLTSPGNTSGLNERVIDIRSETDASRAVSISVSSIDADLTPKEWALEYTACLPDTIEERVVEGYPAVFCIADALGPAPSLIIHHLDKVYLIGWTLTPEESDGMLASLRLPRK